MFLASQALWTRKVSLYRLLSYVLTQGYTSCFPSITVLSQAEVFEEKGSSWQGNLSGLPEPLCLISSIQNQVCHVKYKWKKPLTVSPQQ